MRADQQGCPPVRDVPKGHLFTRGFAVHIDNDGIETRFLRGTGRQMPLEFWERIIQQLHEKASHNVDHLNSATGSVRIDGRTASRGRFGIVRWPKKPFVAVHLRNNVGLVPGMIAAGDDIDTGAEKFVAGLFGHAKAVRRVFAIGNDEIQPKAIAQSRHVRGDRFPPGPAHHIAAK